MDPNPRLAQFLDKRAGVLSGGVREWVTEWVADVGTILRSREFLAYSIASALVGVVIR